MVEVTHKLREAEELLDMQIDDFKGEQIDPDDEPDLYLPLSAAKALHEALTTQATALAAKEAELAAERARVEKLREAARKWHEDAASVLTETQPDETGRGVSGPPDRGQETANATATAPDLMEGRKES